MIKFQAAIIDWLSSNFLWRSTSNHPLLGGRWLHNIKDQSHNYNLIGNKFQFKLKFRTRKTLCSASISGWNGPLVLWEKMLNVSSFVNFSFTNCGTGTPDHSIDTNFTNNWAKAKYIQFKLSQSDLNYPNEILPFWSRNAVSNLWQQVYRNYVCNIFWSSPIISSNIVRDSKRFLLQKLYRKL